MSKQKGKKKMAMKSIKVLREIAEAALEAGVANREQLRNAVPALVALQNAERSMQLRIKETRAVIQALSGLVRRTPTSTPSTSSTRPSRSRR